MKKIMNPINPISEQNNSLDHAVIFNYFEAEAGAIITLKERNKNYFFFFLDGAVKMDYNEFMGRVFCADELIFIPKSAEWKVEVIRQCSILIIGFDIPIKMYEILALNSIERDINSEDIAFNSLLINKQLKQYITQVKQYIHDEICGEELYKLKLQELFFLLQYYYDHEQLVQILYPILGISNNFRNEIMTYFLDVITVKELATKMGYCERHFFDLFVAEFGEAPYSWMQKQKSKYILNRLAQIDLPIKEIAYEFKFSCQSHFTKYCIRQYHSTPTKIRQKLIAKNQ